jgi:predicted glycogen debranching enzyme
LGAPSNGRAWLRSNLGHGGIGRKEAIRSVEAGEAPLHRGWFDRPMVQDGPHRYRITLPLTEVGHFEAKCFFLPAGDTTPIWPLGGNTAINVEPADTGCGNIIYNAFIRQFGPNRDGSAEGVWDALDPSPLDQAGFTVIPPSGTFRDLIRHLDVIVFDLGCAIIQLLPIHPTPTTYARMGRFGSPYAALSFTEVDPALAEFDVGATPLEQFMELVDAIHQRDAKLILDIAINHTGWAARLHGEHPEWLVRGRDGTIEVPGAWGVAWEDLTRLDYSRNDLWIYMADVFLTWCRRGVDGFRCDAGYMIPETAWTYIVARVRDQYPDTLFFLEGLGGKISVTRRLLNQANMNWAYSELFQNDDRHQIESYLPEALDISETDGLTVHFAETHDNLRLAARSKTWARLRVRLCALSSPCGAFAFANGVEWFATAKINVHESPSLNWGAADNLIEDIARLSAILKTHPTFRDRTHVEMIQEGEGNMVVLLRRHLPSDKRLLIAANLSDEDPVTAGWNREKSGIQSTSMVDLLTGRPVTPSVDEARLTVALSPGEVLCLSPDDRDMALMTPTAHVGPPPYAVHQRLRAKAMEIAVSIMDDLSGPEGIDWDRAAEELAAHPAGYSRQFQCDSAEPRVVTWQWPLDTKREVMVPPRHLLLIKAPSPFRVRLSENHTTLNAEKSMPDRDGNHFVLLPPFAGGASERPVTLSLAIYTPEQITHDKATLRALPNPDSVRVRTRFAQGDLHLAPRLFLGTNGRGGMCRAHAEWGALHSRYDALLAANLNPHHPEDRHIMLSRIRAWVVYQGYSQELRPDITDAFDVEPQHRALWRFHLPTGQGESVRMDVELKMLPGENAIRMAFRRQSSEAGGGQLADEKPVEVILRPDIEDRGFHDTTKAFMGPEEAFPNAVSVEEGGVCFSPDPSRTLRMTVSSGRFVREPEWRYQVYRASDANRGLDPDSDLFSPGYFTTRLLGDDAFVLEASVNGTEDSTATTNGMGDVPKSGNPENVWRSAMEAYVVGRGNFKTVIAGYPWFLDWGRDTLIFIRGLIADGRLDASKAIVRQFAAFEDRGTLPNMIKGLDAGNRNTSDAPLWLVIACADICRAEGRTDLLEVLCGNRRLGQVLADMAGALMEGTPNGIRMDPASGLLFSPSHFTWMDTNHPASSPRQGYPVDIAALWFAALNFLAATASGAAAAQWRSLADRVKASISRLFFFDDRGYLSDCLIGNPGDPAEAAVADDALRPNQLLAITLGAVTDAGRCRRILAACEELLVPGAIRSLADRPLSRPLYIDHRGQRLADPHHPYQGRYTGDEDTRRKPAYHNGTAWTWIFPSYCEAWAATYGPASAETALAWLASGIPLTERGCVGHLPEIVDGDAPHEPRGCDAQAWGASEYFRVWRQLQGMRQRVGKTDPDTPVTMHADQIQG